ncbi:hypothetical protein STEG23_021944 [Scotinomys teguina]
MMAIIIAILSVIVGTTFRVLRNDCNEVQTRQKVRVAKSQAIRLIILRNCYPVSNSTLLFDILTSTEQGSSCPHPHPNLCSFLFSIPYLRKNATFVVLV